MAEKGSSSRGVYILSFFTFLNFAAFVGIVVYHVQYERSINNEKLFSGKEIFNQLLDDFKGVLKPGQKRSVDSLYPQLKDVILSQRSILVQECRQEVLKSLAKSSNLNQHDIHKRQTSSPGNDLANIFGEIAKSEVAILAKYCNNGSFVCLPGQKGEVGLQGVKGNGGTLGQKGERGMSPPPAAKGDAGVPGTKGAKGESGPSGVNGVKGDKGDHGTDGQSITGPPGAKGQKGDSADIIPLANQCCNRLKTPDFKLQVETIRTLEGSNISLNCNPNGYPPPTVVWTPQLATLDPARTRATPARVTINNAQVSDGHLYTCLANNALGTSEKQFLVSVFKHIKFDEIPQNYTVLLLKPVTMECMIEGPLGPHISWYKIMPDGSRFLLTNNITPILNGSQLHIDHVTNADVGQYICEGSNGIETVTKTAYIRTYGPPHIIPPGTVYAIAGQNKVLKCETDSYPPSNITWKYPPGVTNAYKETDGTLMVLGAKPKDSTYFICIATNEYGTDQATLQLQVDVAPTVVVTPGSIDLSTGVTSIVVECKVTGDQPLIVSWSKDGTPITSGSHYMILPGNVMYINQPTKADAGQYTCTARNPLGAATGTATVV